MKYIISVSNYDAKHQKYITKDKAYGSMSFDSYELVYKAFMKIVFLFDSEQIIEFDDKKGYFKGVPIEGFEVELQITAV